MILRAGELHTSRSLRRTLKKTARVLKKNTAFPEVIRLCASLRPETWLTPEMIDAYTRLFELGWAESWETYEANKLIGGLYGVVINRAAFLESTFHLAPNAGKEAFVHMYNDLIARGVELFDFQVFSEIADSFGAYEVSRPDYEDLLQKAIR